MRVVIILNSLSLLQYEKLSNNTKIRSVVCNVTALMSYEVTKNVSMALCGQPGNTWYDRLIQNHINVNELHAKVSSVMIWFFVYGHCMKKKIKMKTIIYGIQSKCRIHLMHLRFRFFTKWMRWVKDNLSNGASVVFNPFNPSDLNGMFQSICVDSTILNT